MDVSDTSWLHGVMTPLVTPLRDNEVDHKTYATLVERQIREGVHGVVVNGTSGEPSTLTMRERTQLVETAVHAAAERVPVLAATGSQSLTETLTLSREAVSAGANALLVVTPYYIIPPQRGLVDYYLRIADAVEIPILIYHIPRRAAVGLELSTLQQIVKRAPNVVGIKHSAHDLGFVADVVATLGPTFRVFVGVEDLSMPMLIVGAVGLINAVGNLLPGRLGELYEAVKAEDLRRARAISEELAEVNASVFWDTNPIAVKYMMWRSGLLANNEHRLPMMPATPELCLRLDRVLERLAVPA